MMQNLFRAFLMIPPWIMGIILLPTLPKDHLWRRVPDHLTLRSWRERGTAFAEEFGLISWLIWITILSIFLFSR